MGTTQIHQNQRDRSKIQNKRDRILNNFIKIRIDSAFFYCSLKPEVEVYTRSCQYTYYWKARGIGLQLCIVLHRPQLQCVTFVSAFMWKNINAFCLFYIRYLRTYLQKENTSQPLGPESVWASEKELQMTSLY